MYSKSGCGCSGEDYPQGSSGLGASRGVAIARRPSPRAPVAIVAPTMGQRGAPGRDDYGRSFYRAPGLGFIPWATIIGGAVDLARTFIGGSDATSCPGQYSGAQLGNLLTAMSSTERAALYQLFNKVNAGTVQPEFRGVDLDWMAFAIAGGGDCQVTTTNGKALVAMIHELFAKYPQALAAGSSTPYPTSAPPPVIFTSDPNPWPSSTGIPPVYDPGPAIPDATPSIPDAGPSLWDRIADAAKQAAEAAAAAATRSVATSATQVPAVADQLRIYEEQRKASVISANMPWLIGGGVAIAALLLMPTRSTRR